MNLDFQTFQDGFTIDSTPAAGNIGDKKSANSLDAAATSMSGPRKGIFSFEFFHQFFDVDTDMVFKRMLNSIVPTNNNFILDCVHPVADLWGPFWVPMTLIFSIGIFGNIAQYIESHGQFNTGSDFRMVTSASTLIFSYVLLVPLLVFGVLWARKSELQYAYTDILCAYGYSLTIFVPVSFLWMVNVNWFRWALIFIAVFLSGSVLAKALWPAFKNDTNKLVAFGSIFGVIFLHFLLAFVVKEYYFDAIHPYVPPSPQEAAQVIPGDLPAAVDGAQVAKQKPDDAAKPAAAASDNQVLAAAGTEKSAAAEVVADPKKDAQNPAVPSAASVDSSKPASVDSTTAEKTSTEKKSLESASQPKVAAANSGDDQKPAQKVESAPVVEEKKPETNPLDTNKVPSGEAKSGTGDVPLKPPVVPGPDEHPITSINPVNPVNVKEAPVNPAPAPAYDKAKDPKVDSSNAAPSSDVKKSEDENTKPADDKKGAEKKDTDKKDSSASKTADDTAKAKDDATKSGASV